MVVSAGIDLSCWNHYEPNLVQKRSCHALEIVAAGLEFLPINASMRPP